MYYLASGDPSRILAVPLAGGTPREVSDVTRVADGAMFVSGARLYVGDYEDTTTRRFTLRSMALDGAASRYEFQEDNVVSFARDSGWLHWIDNATGELKAHSLLGSGATVVLHQLELRIDLHADEHGLLWFDGADLWALSR